MHSVQAEGIDVKIVEPVESVFDEEVSYFVGKGVIEIDRGTPGSFVFVREIRPEIRQIIPLRPQVIVDHVEDNGHALGVAGIDQPLEIIRAAVGVVHGKWVHSVVSPVSTAGKLGDRHEFQGIDAEILEGRQARHYCSKCACRRKGADVQLIDDHLRQGQSAPICVLPDKGLLIDHLRGAMHPLRLEVRGRVRAFHGVVQAKAVQQAR